MSDWRSVRLSGARRANVPHAMSPERAPPERPGFKRGGARPGTLSATACLVLCRTFQSGVATDASDSLSMTRLEPIGRTFHVQAARDSGVAWTFPLTILFE
ncbi:MAG: hypothetical protein RJA70_1997 [Pseudomonadota bacterium]|jgi:hypothetical protein